MADTKLAAMSSGAPAAATDIVYVVKDPDGTPLDRKLTLGNVRTLMATTPLQTLADGANIAWDCSLGAKAKVVLGDNRTMSAVTNAIEGTTYTLWLIQDGTGSRTITWTTSGAGSFDFGAAGAPTLTTAINKADCIRFEAISIGGTLKLRCIGSSLGFA